jgi:hypothetical protein
VSINLFGDNTGGPLRPNFDDVPVGWQVTYRLANRAEAGEGDSQFSGF